MFEHRQDILTSDSLVQLTLQHVVSKYVRSLGRSVPRDKAVSILRGIVPGGNDSARRLAVHFGAFAPWDSENISTKTALHDVKEGDDLIAIYVPTRKLSVYQSGVTGGTIVAFETIPFKEIRAIWSFKSVKKGPVKEVKRIYSRVVESEICPGFKDAFGRDA